MANENLKEKLSLTAQLNQIKQEALELEKDSNELGRIGTDLANKAKELAKQKRPILARNYKLAADDVKKQIAKNKLDEKNKKIREQALSAANGLAKSLLTQIGLAGGLAAAFTKFNSLTKAEALMKERLIQYLEQMNEKAKRDKCYYKVKARYDVWPSAYGSLSLSKCRKVGAANWGNKSKKGKK